MSTQLAKVPEYELAIQDAKHSFEQLAGGNLNYGTEEIFAMQMLAKNDFSIQTATRNPRSVQLAMINVASTGLTLNPAMGYAYLVPRDGSIMLDISYKGLIKIATDTGAIAWVRAECVHETDKFIYRGPAAMPDIQANPFGERGEIIGAYCIAKTKDGDILTEVMDLAAIETIRSKSTAFTKGKSGPWKDFFSEMCRKAVIKRARKTWPYTESNERLAKAVEIANEAEGGYTFDDELSARRAAQVLPTSGAWEALTDEDREDLTKVAATTMEYMEADDVKGAHEYLERQSLDSEKKIALWTRFDSKTRSALKKQHAAA